MQVAFLRRFLLSSQGRAHNWGVERSEPKSLADLDAERKRAHESFVKGWVPKDEFLTQREGIDAKVETVNKRMTSLATSVGVGSLDETRRTWDQRPPLARRTVLSRASFATLSYNPTPKGVATTLTRLKECELCFKRRKDRHQQRLLAQRLEVVWRA